MGSVRQAKFVGHGVGIEINEWPVLMARSNDTLQAGMLIAYEPKFVLPEIGAAGIENTYLVSVRKIISSRIIDIYNRNRRLNILRKRLGYFT
jgi:Xaa-Pro aminopeptidase